MKLSDEISENWKFIWSSKEESRFVGHLHRYNEFVIELKVLSKRVKRGRPNKPNFEDFIESNGTVLDKKEWLLLIVSC